MPGSSQDPWRHGAEGLSVAVRVTPRGGRDALDGIETLADGRRVLKLRVRAIADGGAANKAVMALLADVASVPKAKVRLLSGATSRHKQIAIDGDAARIAALLQDALRTTSKEHL